MQSEQKLSKLLSRVNHDKISKLNHKNSKQLKQNINQTTQIEDYFFRCFQQHAINPKKQYIRIKRYYKQENDKNKINYLSKHQQKQQLYQVNDETTVESILIRWYSNRLRDSNQNNQNYYDKNGWKGYLISWNDQFPLQNRFTIKFIKSLTNLYRLNLYNLFRVYFHEESPFQLDQSNISYEQFEKQHSKQISNCFKILAKSNNSKARYFYLSSFGYSSIKDLKISLKQRLDEGFQGIKYSAKEQFRLKIKTQALQNKILEKSLLQLKGLNQISKNATIQMLKQQKYIDFTDFHYSLIRQIVPAGQVIILELDQYQKARFIERKVQRDVKISILCYQRQMNLNKSNSIYESQKIVQKQIIQQYSSIVGLKIHTLLSQHNAQDPMFTSLWFQNKLILKSFQSFSLLSDIIKTFKGKQLRLVSVTQNFLFYKELTQFQNHEYQNSMKNIIERFKLQQSNHNLSQSSTQKCQSLISQKISKIQDPFYKDEEFLDSILLYTSPHIHPFLQSFLRSSSVSLIQNYQVAEKYWQYPFCSKLIRSLLKIRNFIGTTFRGSAGAHYQYKVGQIVEWNNFISTSKKQQIAYTFLFNSQIPTEYYIFEIKTFSGKDIGKYSYVQSEEQVLLFPYTKFKVLSLQQISNSQQVKILQQKNNRKFGNQIIKVVLEQLPVPKKISGSLIVWIDNNVNNSTPTFDKIFKEGKLYNTDVIQLNSNKHLKDWLNHYKSFLDLPNVEIIFITNMNRYQVKDDGVQTLKIIRSVKPDSHVIFYVGRIMQALSFIVNDKALSDKEKYKNIYFKQKAKQLIKLIKCLLNVKDQIFDLESESALLLDHINNLQSKYSTNEEGFPIKSQYFKL